MIVSGILQLDLRRLSGPDLDRALKSVVEAPRLAIVMLTVKKGQLPPVSATQYIRQHGQHLGRVDIVTDDLATIGHWIAAIEREVTP